MQEAESQQKEKEDTSGKVVTETSTNKVIIQTHKEVTGTNPVVQKE